MLQNKTPGRAYMSPSMISLNLFLFICFFGRDKVDTYRLTSDRQNTVKPHSHINSRQYQVDWPTMTVFAHAANSLCVMMPKLSNTQVIHPIKWLVLILALNQSCLMDLTAGIFLSDYC